MNANNLPVETTKKSSKGVALLNKVYEYALNGIPHVTESLDALIYPYIQHSKNADEAIDKFILQQKIKCTTTGFLTGVGGLLTLPVTLSADLASSLYIEMRMIAGIARIRGYNVHDDQVKTAIFLCLAGNAVGDVLKQTGIQVAEKIVAKKILPKLTRDVITSINRKVGFRLLAKGGSKGLVRASKVVPFIGGVIGGGLNWIEVSAYAKYAKAMFSEPL